MQQSQETFYVKSIGQIRRSGEDVILEIDELFRPALLDLEKFSHVMVLWWAEKFDTDEYRAKLHIEPPYLPDRAIGIFATRSPFRPNPIAITTCPILDIDMTTGRVKVANIDAFDGTPIIDLKAYLPICDRVREAQVASWFAEWPEWIPEEGTPLQDPEGGL